MTSIHLLLAFISIGPLMFTFLWLIGSTGAGLPFSAAAGLAAGEFGEFKDAKRRQEQQRDLR